MKTTTLRLFHGSDHRFQPGDEILPGLLVGRVNHALSDPTRVHITPYPGIARVFATDLAKGGQPMVYEVTADNAGEHYGASFGEPGVEWRAARAVVVGVIEDDDIDAWEEGYEAADDIAAWWAALGYRP